MAYSKELILIFISYAVGCISVGYYLTRIFTGKDIRTLGSGSTGARNVGRVLGKAGFIATFLLDIAKGAIVATAAKLLHIHPPLITASLIAVLAGHIWPAQLGFNGGRGISVLIGFLLVFDWQIIAYALLILALCWLIFRKYEIGVFLSIIAIPLLAFFMKHPASDIYGILIAVIIILFAHRAHISKGLQEILKKSKPEL